MVTSVTIHKIHIEYVQPTEIISSEKMESEIDARLLEDFDSHLNAMFGSGDGGVFKVIEAESDVWKAAYLADREIQAIITKWGGRIL